MQPTCALRNHAVAGLCLLLLALLPPAVFATNQATQPAAQQASTGSAQPAAVITAQPASTGSAQSASTSGTQPASTGTTQPAVVITAQPASTGSAQSANAPTTQSANTSAAHPDGTPKVRFTLEELLAPSDVLPVAGNESTAPNALGQYTTYAVELKGQELLANLRAGQFQSVAAYIAKLRDARTQDVNGMDIAIELVIKLSESPAIEPVLRQWLKAEPQSEIALLFYGSWCIKEAWRHRGNDWASNVTEEGWRGFNKFLGKAQHAFTQALELNPQDYLSAGQMITVELGLGGGFERYKWFVRALRFTPITSKHIANSSILYARAGADSPAR